MAEFPTTRWSQIVAGQGGPKARQKLLEELAAAYWQPLYVLARRKGLDTDSAQDAVQALFVKLLERQFVDGLSPEKGRLRSFLRTSLSNQIADLVAHQRARKRGGDHVIVALDTGWADRALADTDSLSPEQAYERAWAQLVFERAFEKLRAEFADGSRTGPFEAITDAFSQSANHDQKDLASKHGLSVSQLKSLLFRARNRLRQLVDEEIGDTVVQPEDVGGERRQVTAMLTLRENADNRGKPTPTEG